MKNVYDMHNRCLQNIQQKENEMDNIMTASEALIFVQNMIECAQFEHYEINIEDTRSREEFAKSMFDMDKVMFAEAIENFRLDMEKKGWKK